MSNSVLVFFAVVGGIASIVAIIQGTISIRERLGDRLVIQVWWEQSLDPVLRTRFRRDVNVGLRTHDTHLADPNSWYRPRRRRMHRYEAMIRNRAPITQEMEESVWADLVEPAWPLSVRHVGANGVWALRLLTYNPRHEDIQFDSNEYIALTVPTPVGIHVLSWQADDGRLTFIRNEDPIGESVNFTIRRETPLRARKKVRDDLAVIYDSRRIQQPPVVSVVPRMDIRVKIKLHEPSKSLRQQLSWTLGRFIGVGPRRRRKEAQ